MNFILLDLFLIIFGVFQFSTAQQSFQSSYFNLDSYAINPAYGGLDDQLNLSLRYRNQWQSLSGSPESIYMSAHLPVYNLSGGAGILLKNERLGQFSDAAILLSYNQFIFLGKNIFSVGIRAGLQSKKLDGDALISATGEYGPGLIEHNDLILPDSPVRGLSPTWGLGFYFLRPSFDLGIVFDELPSVAINLDELVFYKRYTISLHTNYFLDLSSQFRLEASGVLYTDFLQWQSEFGLTFSAFETWFSSFHFRGYDLNTVDALGIGIGGKVNENLLMAYTYELPLSKIMRASKSSHEFLLRYYMDFGFGKKIPESIIHSPRLYE